MKADKSAGFLGSLPFKLAFFVCGLGFFIIGVLTMGVLVCVSGKSSSENINGAYQTAVRGGYPSAVEAYRPLITKLCEEYNSQPDKLNLPDYVNAMLALIEVESSGQGTDPMQASECGYNTRYSHSPNAITDAEYSCRCGVQYARDAFILFGVQEPEDFERLAAAVQGYNFGITGWHSWIAERGGKYSVALAKEYSDTKMPAGAKGTPTHGEKFLEAYKAAITTAGGASADLDNIVYYKQWDERWAGYPYGSGNIQSCGCGITCMAMCAATFADPGITPPVMADLSMKNGGYIAGEGSSMTVVAAAAAKVYALNYQSISPGEIKTYIKKYNALIIWGCNKGYFSNSSSGHVMLIRAMTEDGQVLLADPNREENNTKEFSLEFIQREARGYYIAVWAK